jgi:dethiobiotin synthetase
MSRTIFVTATDTGVGKTTVSAAIARILKNSGKNVGYFKPVETGCQPECNDGYKLSQITGQPVEEIVLYNFKNPVAPIVAEKLEHKKIVLEKIYSHLDHLKSKYEYLIIEWAGGIKVPITRKDGKIITYLDFVYETKLPVLIVSRAGLGTINHTALTTEALTNINAKIKGIILNKFTGKEISEPFNKEIIEEMTGINVISVCSTSLNPEENCIIALKNYIRDIFI